MKSFKLLYLVGILFIAIILSISSYKNTIEEQQATIDSLNQEILLRDNLINQCKDTTYGEEKAITNNHR
jgi:hypothetical protein